MPTAREFLIRGLLAGLLAGVAAFGVAFVVGEPSLTAAIALEGSTADTSAGHEHAAGEPSDGHEHAGTHEQAEPASGSASAEQAVVPRSLQSTLGLLTGTALLGTTLGGLAGVLTAVALGRFGSLGARATSLAVAAVGFVSLTAAPFAVYPPNPPGVDAGDNLGVQTALYATLVAISVIAAATAVLVGRRLAQTWGAWPAGLAAVGGYLAAMVVVGLLLPGATEVPAAYPAAVLYEFRMASLATSLTLWAVLGVVLAELVHRRVRATTPPRPPVRPAAAR